MKTIVSLAITIISLDAFTPSVSAENRISSPRVLTVGYDSCAPRYVCTKEVCRRTECRWTKDHCGRRYRYEVTVITFADHYSDGSRRTYTKTYRA